MHLGATSLGVPGSSRFLLDADKITYSHEMLQMERYGSAHSEQSNLLYRSRIVWLSFRFRFRDFLFVSVCVDEIFDFYKVFAF